MAAKFRRLHCTIKGDVQGVGFRAFSRHHANDIRIDGWVKNLWDGSVEIMAEGSPESVEIFLKLLSRGPIGAYISDVEIHEDTEATSPEFSGFSIHF